MEYRTLNNGIKMPMAGIGVFMLTPDQAEAAVESALKSGVRLVDTANGYMNESATGRGIKKSGVAREDIFLVTKLWPTVYEKETAIEETLKRLDTDYIDLLLEAINTMEIKPQVVQVEAHPYFPQTELKKILSKYDMGLMAWYPLGHGDKNLVNEKVFTELADKYGKSNAQIILRWHVQSGNVVIPGSKNPDHIRDNFDIFDFELTDEDMKKIESVNKNTRYYTATPELIAQYAKMELKEDI